MIRVSHLRKEYPLTTPLKDVSVEIKDGEVISIIGPSGTGKSTLLRCLNMLEMPTSGKIFIDEEEITAPGCHLERVRQKMGMVFQSFNLFPHLTVIENIMYAPRKLLGLSKEEAHKRGMELLETVGLMEKENAYPDELSGGQKQRVAIARALAMEPKILLFDEPTSALDPTMVGEVLMVIRNLAKKGITMLIVTHEMRFARMVSTRIFYMDQGELYEEGTPEEIFENPKRERTRLFIHQLKVFDEDIYPKYWDMPAFASNVTVFVHKHLIPKTLGNKLQGLIKYLVFDTILPTVAEPEPLHFRIEYSDESENVTVILKWKGRSWNPVSEMKPECKTWLTGEETQVNHEWSEGSNILKVKLS